ncbi:hypothetical protein CH063_05199 [Colletotrichum higginsianum]|uniref:Uncharacterized protein n=1 Tax=Colletotrichum higginsianum (strain IMI 349063) TaxID=759273 RepID=H1UY64_COLHI|nr:hypothetical protein CH063_05199 [Colletotrichum higginsianum]
MYVFAHCAACHGPRPPCSPLTWRGKEAAILAPGGCFLIATRRRGWEGARTRNAALRWAAGEGPTFSGQGRHRNGIVCLVLVRFACRNHDGEGWKWETVQRWEVLSCLQHLNLRSARG